MYRALLILSPSQFQGRKKHSYSKHSSILIHVIQDIPQGTKISTSSPNLVSTNYTRFVGKKMVEKAYYKTWFRGVNSCTRSRSQDIRVCTWFLGGFDTVLVDVIEWRQSRAPPDPPNPHSTALYRVNVRRRSHHRRLRHLSALEKPTDTV